MRASKPSFFSFSFLVILLAGDVVVVVVFMYIESTRDMLYENIPSNGSLMQLLRPKIPEFLIPILFSVQFLLILCSNVIAIASIVFVVNVLN